MNRTSACAALIPIALASALIAADDEAPPIQSRVLITDADERILAEEVLIDAPIDEVWDAYATSAGWESWASPNAEVDLRVGGTIRTNYDPDAELGDPGTNTLHIVNYVPGVVLTLQAEMQDNWPDLLKQDADRLMNVILFESLGDDRTRLRAYGVGYGDAPAYDSILGFFAEANQGLYRNLKRYVEDGEKARFKGR